MKQVRVTNTQHKSLGKKVVGILEDVEQSGVYLKFKLFDRLEDRNLSLRDFAKITGLRLATLSDIANGTKQSINIHHIIVIMVALRITDLTELIEIVFPEESKELYQKETRDWVQLGKIPQKVFDFLDKNPNE